ncbi:MAG: DUF1801 domain-containing protein [Sphingobacteriia bacterium]|nr:DUF1801 domain-containing protein [Sphingobacteriia bacterium]
MAKPKYSNSELVTQYIADLSENIQPEVEYLRQVMLSVSEEIAEHIKWNAPAFYYSGEMKEFNPKEYKRDVLVMNLRKNTIMCVLPTGMNIKKNTELLEGNYTDGRRMIYFKDLNDIKQKEQQLIDTIKEWIDLIEK